MHITGHLCSDHPGYALFHLSLGHRVEKAPERSAFTPRAYANSDGTDEMQFGRTWKNPETCLDPDKQNHTCCQQGLGKNLSPPPDRHVRKTQDKKGRETKKTFSL